MDDESTKITIDRIEMGTGWVCFQPGDRPPSPDRLPAFLNECFYTWLQRNPDFNIRATMPIVENGQTVLLHVWFDRGRLTARVMLPLHSESRNHGYQLADQSALRIVRGS